jgi:hypothetical protein
MSFARNIIRDLVEKRLWPVALLMVVAIIAIPVLGGGTSSSNSSSDEALPTTPGATATAASAIELIGPPAVRTRAGKLVDPFRRSKVKEPDTTTTSSGSEPATGGATAPEDSGSGTDTTTPAPSLAVYRTSVRFGTSDSDSPAKERRISRLTPLGELLNPAAMYLGVDAGGKHALFLLGPDATSDGEATCHGANCRVIALAPGETQVIDQTPLGAAPQQFDLEVASVTRHKLASAAKAANARKRVHPDGADVLRLIAEDAKTLEALSGFAYDRSRGVVVASGVAAPSAG